MFGRDYLYMSRYVWTRARLQRGAWERAKLQGNGGVEPKRRRDRIGGDLSRHLVMLRFQVQKAYNSAEKYQ